MELSLAVESALGRLSGDQREAVLLKIYQGFKFEEMAEILDCPVSTIKSRLYTALDLLKQTLAPVKHRRGGMSCSSVDLKAYVLGELAAAERAPVAKHLEACQDCREELERLNVTRAALLSLAEEEAPQRIAFVSDKVFEPRWWQTIWHSGPVMGFASAGVLAVAILVHAYRAAGRRYDARTCRERRANRTARREPGDCPIERCRRQGCGRHRSAGRRRCPSRWTPPSSTSPLRSKPSATTTSKWAG